VTVHREGRTAELPLVGAGHKFDPRSVRQVCEALGLDWSDLPRPKGRVWGGLFVGGRVMSEWFVPPIVIPAVFVVVIVALALYRLFVGA
jgi:hypothetical protein